MSTSFIDCEHQYDLIRASSGRGDGMHSHEVRICLKCGQFHVHTRTGGLVEKFTFVLMIPEQVRAASQYVNYLVDSGVTYPVDDNRE